MRDLTDDDNRLRSLSSAPTLLGFGQVPASERQPGDELTSAEVFVEPGTLSEQSKLAYPVPANAVPVVQTLTLPQFNFSTGVASCTDCASDGATTSNAVAKTAAIAATVKPLPPTPSTTNWLLWAMGLGVAFYAFKGPDAGLGCPDDAPARPAPALNGAPPPRRPEPKKLKHVDSLKIS